ncbi:hypothetical protein OKHIF_33320 [Mycobacteroides chelonae]|jgi:hypothetical protein
MVTPAGVVGAVTIDAVDGTTVLTVTLGTDVVTPGTDVDVTGAEGAVVVSVTMDGVDVAVDVDIDGVEVTGTVVEVEPAEPEVLVDVEPGELVVSVGDEVVAVVSDVDVDGVVDVVSDAEVDIDVVEVVEVVVAAITGGDSIIRGVSVAISGGTVATGSLASILTSACCTRLASSAFCWASPTSLTRAAATPSCCCAPSQSPWEISFSTWASSVCAESTTGSVRTAGAAPNNEVRSPYNASPGCDW